MLIADLVMGGERRVVGGREFEASQLGKEGVEEAGAALL
jgi:hypothetical protein